MPEVNWARAGDASECTGYEMVTGFSGSRYCDTEVFGEYVDDGQVEWTLAQHC